MSVNVNFDMVATAILNFWGFAPEHYFRHRGPKRPKPCHMSLSVAIGAASIKHQTVNKAYNIRETQQQK